jgi:MFS family permease
MLGAAVGGIVLDSLGDLIGRTRAMGVSVLFYSLFAGLGALAKTQEQMLALRFLVGLGVGGMWPNGVVLVSECWPNASRPVVAGVMGAGINFGVLILSQLARVWSITPDSWRWLFKLAAVPAAMGILVLFALPESPKWLAAASSRRKQAPTPFFPSSGSPLCDLFRPPLLRLTLLGIVLASIPLVGAWAASKWMIPWADTMASATQPSYQAARTGLFAGGVRARLPGHAVLWLAASLPAGVVSHARPRNRHRPGNELRPVRHGRRRVHLRRAVRRFGQQLSDGRRFRRAHRCARHDRHLVRAGYERKQP